LDLAFFSRGSRPVTKETRIWTPRLFSSRFFLLLPLVFLLCSYDFLSGPRRIFTWFDASKFVPTVSLLAHGSPDPLSKFIWSTHDLSHRSVEFSRSFVKSGVPFSIFLAWYLFALVSVSRHAVHSWHLVIPLLRGGTRLSHYLSSNSRGLLNVPDPRDVDSPAPRRLVLHHVVPHWFVTFPFFFFFRLFLTFDLNCFHGLSWALMAEVQALSGFVFPPFFWMIRPSIVSLSLSYLRRAFSKILLCLFFPF